MTTDAATPAGFWERVEQVAERVVAKYARSGASRNMSISEGGTFTVRGGKYRVKYPSELGGGDAVYIGDIYETGTGAYLGTGMLVQAPDGTDIAVFRTDALFGTTMHNIYDSGGRIIFGNDAASGQGMARPYVGGVFARARYVDSTVSTTSSSFETLWDAWIPKQHPKLEVAYRASMDTAATTGEARVLVDGQQLGATTAEAFVFVDRFLPAAPVAGEHMKWLHVEIQGRRTSATGALRIEPIYLLGKQT